MRELVYRHPLSPKKSMATTSSDTTSVVSDLWPVVRDALSTKQLKSNKKKSRKVAKAIRTKFFRLYGSTTDPSGLTAVSNNFSPYASIKIESEEGRPQKSVPISKEFAGMSVDAIADAIIVSHFL